MGHAYFTTNRLNAIARLRIDSQMQNEENEIRINLLDKICT